MIKFVAYVDEAGDEGFGKLGTGEKTAQSKWFAIGAMVVQDTEDRNLPSWRNEIVDFFPRKKSRDLHFRDLKHEQRVQACRILATKPAGACVVVSNKVTLLSHPKKDIFKQKQYLYNYLTRFLLERITEACAQKARVEHRDKAHLTVVFSRRRGTDYQAMKQYLEFMRDGKELIRPVRSIDWSVLDPADIAVENHSIRAGLQLADVYTSAIWTALEPNEFGFYEPRYGQTLASRLMKKRSRRLGCGLTLIPPYGKTPLTDDENTFVCQVRDFQK